MQQRRGQELRPLFTGRIKGVSSYGPDGWSLNTYRSNEGYLFRRRLIAKNKWESKMEHRAVMETMLGRDLLPGENIHHKNGVRNDNRPANLELWVTMQPTGQRPEDLVAWAREILARYP